MRRPSKEAPLTATRFSVATLPLKRSKLNIQGPAESRIAGADKIVAQLHSPNMTAHKVELKHLLLLQHLDDELVADLKQLFDKVTYLPRRNAFGSTLEGEEEPTKEHLRDADVIFSFVLPTALQSQENAPRLKLFQGLSAGFGHITDKPYFDTLPNKSSDPIFASASGIHVSTISEHVLSTVITLFHRLHLIYYRMRSDQTWYREPMTKWHNYIKELRDLTIGILGNGHIGRETARLFAGCGARIVALTRTGEPSPEKGYIIEGTGDPSGSIPDRYYSSSDRKSTLEFFSACDVIVNTLPDSESTRGFVGKEELKAMRGDAIFVNIGRGTTVDQDALVEALKAEPAQGEKVDATGTLRIGGASLDVTTPEPLPDGHALYSLDNVILTPHMSGLSLKYYVRAVDLLKVNVARVRAGKGAFNAFHGRGEDD